jgi:hypothetical protein
MGECVKASRRDGRVPSGKPRVIVEKKTVLGVAKPEPRVAWEASPGRAEENAAGPTRVRSSRMNDSANDKRMRKPILFVGLDVHKETNSSPWPKAPVGARSALTCSG